MNRLIALLAGLSLVAAGAVERSAAEPAEPAEAVEPAARVAPAASPRTVGGDERKRWILHEPLGEAPEAGYALLVVLPGGDGSAEFAPFVGGAIRREAGEDVIVAQAVAPPIAEDDRGAIVWPTERLRDDRVDFTVEPMILAIVESVRAERPVDPRRVYVMGWSSGGPPAYAVTLGEESPFTGAFVVMSVFKPETLPGLGAARGKSYFILHSREDFIAMRFPEAAVEALKEAGARVRLETYKGGHGWRGDSVSRIGGAVRWLDGAE